VDLVDNLDGTLSIFGTTVDHVGPASHRGSISGPLALASLSRELSVNDWQNRTDVRRGGIEDRNVELVLPAPFIHGGDHGEDAFLNDSPTESQFLGSRILQGAR
jgi:hypothetical protein